MVSAMGLQSSAVQSPRFGRAGTATRCQRRVPRVLCTASITRSGLASTANSGFRQNIGNGSSSSTCRASAQVVPAEEGIPHRWFVVAAMVAAFVLCNMDKVRNCGRWHRTAQIFPCPLEMPPLAARRRTCNLGMQCQYLADSNPCAR